MKAATSCRALTLLTVLAVVICTATAAPALPTNSFCQWPGMVTSGSSSIAGCSLLSRMHQGLQSLPATGRTCPASAQSKAETKSVNGTMLPLPLTDLRPLPQDIPLPQLSDVEGASLYWHLRNLYNFHNWVPCAATNDQKTLTLGHVHNRNASLEWLAPNGWVAVSTVWLKDGTQQTGEYMPFATVIKNSRMVSVLIRGSKTVADWNADFDYRQIIGGADLKLPGQVHAGITAIASTLWSNGIKAAIDREVMSSGRISVVTFAGHSLGAGVATLLSYTAQAYINKQRGLNRRLPAITTRVDAMLFAPPNVGDSTFVNAFNKLVNARRIVFEYDLVPQVPCAPSMTACLNTPIVTSNPDGSGVWHYSAVGGSYTLKATTMPQQPQVWAQLSTFMESKLRLYLLASHTCSYICYFSAYVADTNNNCLLKTQSTDGGIGSFCSGTVTSFPDSDNPPYPTSVQP